ncbi:FtsX-like permease family protein [Clostridium sp. LP20]|uniref:FtsX-like permease family protein n=1 Tax=Clostridium sp. LP20 TaxID=3418665 RepID=UPI003EE80444
MGIYKFIRKIFKANFNKNIFYIITIAITTAFIFNLINISTNKYIDNEVVYSYEGTYIDANGEIQEYGDKLSPAAGMGPTLLLLVGITCFFSAFCNGKHIRRKGNELAFILSNGGSLVDLARYLVFTNGCCYLIGAGLGVVLGIGSTPIFNGIIYWISGINAPLFVCEFSYVWLTLLYIAVQYFAIVTLNFGYAYRNEVIDLIKGDNTKNFVDKRNVRTPGFVFFLIYLTPIMLTIWISKIKGGEIAIYFVAYLGLIGLYGTIKYFIPKIIILLKKKKFMFKNNRIIYVSNFMNSLSKSIVYLIAMAICFNNQIYSVVDMYDIPVFNAMAIFGVVITSVVVGATLIYSLFVDSEDRIPTYNQMRILGYNRKEIGKIIYKEAGLFFTLGILLSLIIQFCTLYIYVVTNSIPFDLGLKIALFITIPFFLIGTVSAIINKRKVMKAIYEEASSNLIIV